MLSTTIKKGVPPTIGWNSLIVSPTGGDLEGAPYLITTFLPFTM